MKKLTLVATLLGVALSSGAQAQGTFSGAGVKSQSLTIKGDAGEYDVSQKLLTVEFGREASDYVDVRVWAGFAITDAETNVQTDTYILDHMNPEVLTDEYRSTTEIVGEYGIDATLSLPIKQSWWAYASAGYQITHWEGQSYTPFADTPPSANPAADFEAGADKCAVTGQESACGVNIALDDRKGGSGVFKGAVGELGLRWALSESTQMTFGYRRTFGSESATHGVTAGLRFVW